MNERRKKFTYKGAPDIIMPIIRALSKVNVEELLFNATEQLRPLIVGKKYSPKSYATLSLSRMRDQGLIRLKSEDGQKFYILTLKGEKRLALSNLRPNANKETWDGKWRMVVFDIREIDRRNRDILRQELRAQGFGRLQNSVWVYPYECYDYVALLKTELKNTSEVIYATVDKLENDYWLLEKFGLDKFLK